MSCTINDRNLRKIYIRHINTVPVGHIKPTRFTTYTIRPFSIQMDCLYPVFRLNIIKINFRDFIAQERKIRFPVFTLKCLHRLDEHRGIRWNREFQEIFRRNQMTCRITLLFVRLTSDEQHRKKDYNIIEAFLHNHDFIIQESNERRKSNRVLRYPNVVPNVRESVWHSDDLSLLPNDTTFLLPPNHVPPLYQDNTCFLN